MLGNGSLQTEESAEKEDAGEEGTSYIAPKVMRGEDYSSYLSVLLMRDLRRHKDHEDNGYHTDKYEISVQRYLLAERI